MAPRASVVLLGAGEAGFELRDFLTRIDQPYMEPGAQRQLSALERLGLAADDLPAVVVDDVTIVRRPSLEQLADALGVRHAPTASHYDLVVVGGGPAGLAAAVHAASDGLRTVVIERSAPGGQAAFTSRIENYFGIDPAAPPTTGAHLARVGGRQAELFGAELLVLRGATAVRREGDGEIAVKLSSGETLSSPALLCAAGIDWRRLEIDGIEPFVGRGVYYGAGSGEASRLRGKAAVVVGAGNSAGQAALNLSAHGARVTMLCRGSELGASLSRYLINRIAADSSIEVRLRTELAGIDGDGRLREVVLSTRETLAADAVFVAIGGEPRTGWLSGLGLDRDSQGYVLTDAALDPTVARRPRLPLETSASGVFAAGDVRHGGTKRVASAVGDGATAVASVHRFLAERDSFYAEVSRAETAGARVGERT